MKIAVVGAAGRMGQMLVRRIAHTEGMSLAGASESPNSNAIGRDAGRGLPDGLKFVASYVSADLGRCFQLMETDDVTLFQRWIADWQDVVEFEVVPVVEGKATREALGPML